MAVPKLRANVYTTHGLTTGERSSVCDGINLVTTYMQTDASIEVKKVSLPQDSDGYTQARRIGFAALDPMVELHIFAMPLDFTKIAPIESSGVADTGNGLVFVNVADQNNDLCRTVAHEAAHAFGFKPPKPIQEDEYHCVDSHCTLFPYQDTRKVTNTVYRSQSRGRILDFLTGKQTVAEEVTRVVPKQQDFCGDCKADLFTNGHAMLRQLRLTRILYGMPRSLRSR